MFGAPRGLQCSCGREMLSPLRRPLFVGRAACAGLMVMLCLARDPPCRGVASLPEVGACCVFGRAAEQSRVASMQP
eukprot:4782153-Prymnesium_polylepis.2